jgi:hypothetical protein
MYEPVGFDQSRDDLSKLVTQFSAPPLPAVR